MFSGGIDKQHRAVMCYKSIRRFENHYISEKEKSLYLSFCKFSARARGKHWSCSIKNKSCSKKFRNIHRKTPVLESLLIKLQAFRPSNFIKKRVQHTCFPKNITKGLRTPILKNICEWLLLKDWFASTCFIKYLLNEVALLPMLTCISNSKHK